MHCNRIERKEGGAFPCLALGACHCCWTTCSIPTSDTTQCKSNQRHVYHVRPLALFLACTSELIPVRFPPTAPRLFLYIKHHACLLVPCPSHGCRNDRHHQRPPPPFGALRREVPRLGQGTDRRDKEGREGGREEMSVPGVHQAYLFEAGIFSRGRV